MAYFFGDGFDLYAAPADAINGYWDSQTLVPTLVAGRFSGSRALQLPTNLGTSLTKSSGSNDAVHHIVVAFQSNGPISGTNYNNGFTLLDGTTAQCSIVFRQDGAILLLSGGNAAASTVLATYTGAYTLANTWYAFEFEVVIHNTAGSFAVRKNGNTTNDFTATSLNTRGGTANNYANKLSLTGGANGGALEQLDDLLWRSDASSVPWVGDIRCFTRMPASDVAVQWTPSGSVVPDMPFTASTTATRTSLVPSYTPVTAVCNGTIGSVLASLSVGGTGNLKCTIFANSGSNTPGTVLGSATTLANPAAGNNTLTFGSPVPVTQGTTYWVGFQSDISLTWNVGAGSFGVTGSGSPSYASFPVANPSTTANLPVIITANITSSSGANAPFVADITQDGANSYVYSSTVSQSDRYGIAAIGSTPASIVGVTTRGYFQKSDAGTRNVAVQLQSGATNVQSASTALNTAWGWISRTDLVDPATGSAWTATGVNNAQIGAVVTA